MSGSERETEREKVAPSLPLFSLSITHSLACVCRRACRSSSRYFNQGGGLQHLDGQHHQHLSLFLSLSGSCLPLFPFLSLSLSLSCFYTGAPASLLSLPSGSSTAHSGGHVHRNLSLSLSPSLLPWCVAFRERDEARAVVWGACPSCASTFRPVGGGGIMGVSSSLRLPPCPKGSSSSSGSSSRLLGGPCPQPPCVAGPKWPKKRAGSPSPVPAYLGHGGSPVGGLPRPGGHRTVI